MFLHVRQQDFFTAAALSALVCVSCFSIQAHAQNSGKNASPPRTAQAPGAAAPQAPSGVAPNPQSGEKLDVSDLEKKYWAAKDTDFSVVQNRLYSKANRPALTFNYGYAINDPWSDGGTVGGTVAYYFSERLGLELTYTSSDMRDNKATSTLKGQLGSPDHNKLKGFTGASIAFVPFYAKMSVLNSTIIYFDMSFSLGGGLQEYSQQRDDGNTSKSSPTITLDVTQHYFLSRHFAIRLDLKNRWYQEEVVKYRLPAGAPVNFDRKVSNDWANTSMLMFGLELLY